MRVAVTGAGGYVGRALVASLEAAGHDVTALIRRAAPADGAPAPRRVVVGDVREAAILDDLVADADAVAHLAAFVHRRAVTERDARECFDVNLGGTRALLAALARRGGSRPFVFVSTVAVYGPRFERADEATLCHPVSPYARSKLAAEYEVLRAGREGSIRGHILRPAVVYGPGAPGNVVRLLRWVRRGVVPLPGADGAKSMVHVDDLTACVARSLAGPPAAGATIRNAAGEPPVTVRRMVECLARGAGRAPRLVPVPDVLARGLAAATRAWLPGIAASLDTLLATSTVDASAASRDLGIAFRSTEAGLETLGATLAAG